MLPEQTRMAVVKADFSSGHACLKLHEADCQIG